MTDTSTDTLVVGVVGAGTMGAGIAQVAIEAGHEVILHDVDEAAVERGMARVADGLRRRAAKAGLDEDAAAERVDGQLERLRSAETLALLAGGADLVIEAAVEDFELKRDVFRALDAAAPADAILATNTSALSIGALAEATTRADKVLGLHFFNPAPVMALVEVVVGVDTDPAVADRAADLMTAWGKTPVRCADAPGFIVNRVNRPFTLEALRTLEAGQATIEGIDEAVRAAGFPMGPFAFMDLVGLDVNLAAARSLFEAFGHPARFRPSPIQEELVATDQLGRKRGIGFYRYADGQAIEPGESFAGEAPTGVPLATEDIVERIVLSIVNEAYHALGDGVATRDDIDLAMRLGANHPFGPFEWAAERGLDRVHAGLEALRQAEGERFAPAPALVEELATD